MTRKICLVTVRGRSIGAADARAMHARGYGLVLMSPSESCEVLAAEPGDVARRGTPQSEEYLKAVVGLPMATDGRAHAVRNHTGHPPKGDPKAITDDNWDLVHEMILKSVVRSARRTPSVMAAQGSGSVHERAKAAALLLTDQSSYVTGQTLRVDGGLTRHV